MVHLALGVKSFVILKITCFIIGPLNVSRLILDCGVYKPGCS